MKSTRALQEEIRMITDSLIERMSEATQSEPFNLSDLHHELMMEAPERIETILQVRMRISALLAEHQFEREDAIMMSRLLDKLQAATREDFKDDIRSRLEGII